MIFVRKVDYLAKEKEKNAIIDKNDLITALLFILLSSIDKLFNFYL